MLRHLEKNVLSGYYSGDLSEPESRRCEEHLRKCDTCREEFTSLVQLLDENVNPDEIAILDNVEATITKSVPLHTQSPNVPRRTHWWSGQAWSVAAVAASIIFLVAVTWGVFSDRKSTRLNSSHRCISYAVFCLKKKR